MMSASQAILRMVEAVTGPVKVNVPVPVAVPGGAPGSGPGAGGWPARAGVPGLVRPLAVAAGPGAAPGNAPVPGWVGCCVVAGCWGCGAGVAGAGGGGGLEAG